MDRRKFLIVGGGLAAVSAVQAIRETGETGSILVVPDEADPPYNGPALSKGLWKGQAVGTIWRPIDAAIAELRLGTKIVALDPTRKTVTSATGTSERGIGCEKRDRCRRAASNERSIFAAGDVANFPCAALQQRIRVEHEDNAVVMGRIAGYNMAGRSEPYRHLPSFYSDLFDLG